MKQKKKKVKSNVCHSVIAGFSYNNALSATTSVFLFFTNKRYHLNITIHSECNIAFSQAYDFAVDLNELQSILKVEISVA